MVAKLKHSRVQTLINNFIKLSLTKSITLNTETTSKTTWNCNLKLSLTKSITLNTETTSKTTWNCNLLNKKMG